jgi:Terminase RNaseH-like domain
MLSDYQGQAWFLSTPKGMNYFKTLFDSGQDPEQTEWASWQMPTAENPRIAPEEIESARLGMTEAAFNQEYLALFVNWEGSVFRRVGEAATASWKTKPETGHHYVIGCDWGRSHDYTVFIVVDITAGTVVAMERSKQVDYAVQRERLRVLCERWQPEQIIAKQNSIGLPIIEQLTRNGLRIDAFTTTNASKAHVIEALALAFEHGDIRIPNDPVLVGELVAYQAERLPSGFTICTETWPAPSRPEIRGIVLNQRSSGAICRRTASFLFRATRSRGRSCLFQAFSGAALALSTRHGRDLLPGSRCRTLRFHGCGVTRPAIDASALLYFQSKENGKVFPAEDLTGSRRLLGLGKSLSARDEFLFVHVVQPEDEVGLLVQPCANAIEHGRDVLAHIRPIGTTA